MDVNEDASENARYDTMTTQNNARVAKDQKVRKGPCYQKVRAGDHHLGPG